MKKEVPKSSQIIPPTKKYKDYRQVKKFDLFRDYYEGDTIDVLAERYDMNPDTLKRYMNKNGIFYNDYKTFEEGMNQEVVAEARTVLKKGVRLASKVLISKLGSRDDNVQLRASLAVLEREFGKAVQPLEHSGKLTITELMQMAKERKKNVGDQKEKVAEVPVDESVAEVSGD